MNEKLLARKQKRREVMNEKSRGSFQNSLPWQRRTSQNDRLKDDQDDLEEDNIDLEVPTNPWYARILYFLYFCLWVTLYIIAVKIEFGAVYFIVTTLIFILVNTRSGPKKKGEVSAYSVFNKNCEPIDGTLDPKQFEKELVYGPSGMHL